IIDCKVDRDHPSFQSAPSIQDYLNESSKEYFTKVLEGLDALKVPYVVDDHLVRGLDSYSNTVFEAVPVADGGQQAALFAGGQYDSLVGYYGGGDLPGVGFGMGLERIITLAQEENGLDVKERSIDAYVIALGDVGTYALEATQRLREAGFKAETDYQGRSLKAQFKATERLRAQLIVIIGDEEKNNGTVNVKNVATQQQETIKAEQLVEYAAAALGRK
ncbi:MAG: ATP phosphoribosyltransferase regulatory subunit, partial [Erysipelotrichaceae bacterium]|nr:ATP phosphoribosyltransferase regulatory subunit [Erysipelotrichaceae bacterium]